MHAAGKITLDTPLGQRVKGVKDLMHNLNLFHLCSRTYFQQNNPFFGPLILSFCSTLQVRVSAAWRAPRLCWAGRVVRAGLLQVRANERPPLVGSSGCRKHARSHAGALGRSKCHLYTLPLFLSLCANLGRSGPVFFFPCVFLRMCFLFKESSSMFCVPTFLV